MLSFRTALLAPSVFPASKHFSSKDEKELLSNYLAGMPGIFVEVGANHPVKGSQTFHLEQAGWTGLLIEPLAEIAERVFVNNGAP